jgi:hypothetical protein
LKKSKRITTGLGADNQGNHDRLPQQGKTDNKIERKK